MSLAERLRAAKSNGLDDDDYSHHEKYNPSVTVDMTDSELNALASRLIGGSTHRAAPAAMETSETTTKRVKRGGKKMRGKKKAAFLKRMAAGKKKKAKSNPRPKAGQRFHKDFSRAGGVWKRASKRNPTRAETAAREDFLTMRMAAGDTRAQADAAWRNALGMSAAARRKSGKKLGVRRRFGGLARVRPASIARYHAPKKKKSKKRKTARRSYAMARMSKGYRAYMRNRLAGKIAQVRGRGGRKAWYVNARLGALRARYRSYGPRVSAAAREYLRAHGLSKVNPGGGIVGQLKDGGKAIVAVLPEILVAVGSAGVHTYVGAKAGEMLVKKYGASYSTWSAPAASLAVGVLGFLGLRMSPATSKFSVPFLTGGVVGAAVNLLADNHTKGDAASPSVSWGRALALPIGSVVLRSEFAGFDPTARHQMTSVGEVLPRRDFSGMGEVVSRRESVAMVGEAEDRALARLLGEAQLASDTAAGF